MKSKSGDKEFDVPMTCFGGAKVDEVVGVYILHLLRTFVRKEKVGLYRDDGLGVLRDSSDPEIERKRKRIIQIFKGCGLNITGTTNLKAVDFLEVNFNLVNNTYQPYPKSNSEAVYINKLSNRPRKQLLNEYQTFHITKIFLMLQKPDTNKHYVRVVLMKN